MSSNDQDQKQQSITNKIDALINTVQTMNKTNDNDKKQQSSSATTATATATPPSKPEQNASEYDLTKPYRICVASDNHGGPEKLRVENFDVDAISLQDNQILIDIHSSGINFIDTYHRSGLYKGVDNLGKEGAGVVIKIGSGVTNYVINDKVCWFSIQGSYATHIIAAADHMSLRKIPNELFADNDNDEDVFNIGASIGIQALTAHYLCRSLYPVNNGTSVLIHAGAGGTGGLLIQICKNILKSPLVITTVGSKKKAEIAKQYGADHCILYKDLDFAAEVNTITKNQGVNVVFDGVGKSTYMKSLQCTTIRGMCVLFGNASGAVPPIDPLTLTKNGSVFITRPTLSHYIRSADELKFRYDELFNWIKNKSININIGQIYKLSSCFNAHIDLESRKTIGKIILKKNIDNKPKIDKDQDKDKGTPVNDKDNDKPNDDNTPKQDDNTK